MTVPEDFHLEPVKPSSFPGPEPPRTFKRDIYSDAVIFQNVDDHAVAEARVNYDNFRDLMWNLVFRNNYGELEKARAIFRWLTAKDLTTINLRTDGSELPERILNDFKQGKGSYARAFEFMARYSGLCAVSIKGWAKGIAYVPSNQLIGQELTSESPNHSWNAVYISGSWHLIDSNWASNRQAAEDALAADYDEFYFLTDPTELKFSHFPENPAWQLLSRELTAAEFEVLPHLKSHFFTLGLRVLSQIQGVLYANHGLLTLTLGFSKPTAFTYKISYGSDKEEWLNDVDLSKYVLQEMTDNRLTYYFRARFPGNYHLTIFARDARNGVPKGSIVFKSVAEYEIVVPLDASFKAHGPFPYCSDSSWGSDVYVHQYPIVPSIKSAILLCPTGRAELVFEKAPNLKLYARLVHDGISFEELKSWLTYEEVKGQTVLRVDLKRGGGEYGLEIFANDPEVDGEVFTHFSQYLLVSLDQKFSSLFGYVFDRDDLPSAKAHHDVYSLLEQDDLSQDDVVQAKGHHHVYSLPEQDNLPEDDVVQATEHHHVYSLPEQDNLPEDDVVQATEHHHVYSLPAQESDADEDADVDRSMLYDAPPAAAAAAGDDHQHEKKEAETGLDADSDVDADVDVDSDVDAVDRSMLYDADDKRHNQGMKIYDVLISKEPPKSFEAAPISDEDVVAKRPSGSYRPRKVFDDFSIFRDVDGHSVEVSKVQHGNFRDLIWHLIYARNITDELEKARAIFVYLSSTDLSRINFDRVEADSPEEMLMNLKNGRTTYARVYETLCRYAGLNCETVTGYAKGADYRPGVQFAADEGQHSWNAVYVSGTWQLVDCHWAARRLVGKQVAGDNVRYELDDYYFMPESSQLIFTHFPLVTIWQLLERPISLEEFENLVPVKSAFFKHGLHIVSHRDAVIHSDGDLTIAIGCPKGKTLAFTFSLNHFDFGENFCGIVLNQFAMNYQKDGRSYFRLRLPEHGSYQLVLYAKELVPNQANAGMFGGVCEYEIIVDKTPVNPPLPFPPCAHTTWGPGDSFSSYDLQPRHRDAIIHTVNGATEVRFTMKEELRFTAKLKSALIEDETQLAPYLIQRVVGDVAIFYFKAPLVGEFGLDVYANNPQTDGQSLHHVYQYLVVCDQAVPVEPFPALPPNYLGPQQQFKPLGLTLAGPEDPFIVLEGGEFQLSFTMTQPTRMSCQLLFSSEDGDRDYSEYSLQQSGENSITYVFKLPSPGYYKVQFFALPASDPSESLPGVYNCLVECRSTFVSSVPYPKQYGIWREGCYLYEPLDGHLQPNRPSKGGASTYQHVFFSLDVPKATSVVVVIGEEWFPLDQKKGTSAWNGEVQMESFWERERKLSVVASYDDPPSRFGTLLEYSM